MKEGDYEVGYAKPPRAHQWQKGQSGNRHGRRVKPAPTWAKVIESAWLEAITVTTAGIRTESTGFELISLQLLIKIADGSRKAYTVFRKYESFAKSKPRLVSRRSGKGSTLSYAQMLGLKDDAGQKFSYWNSKEPEIQERRRLEARVARMKAGLEQIEISGDMTSRDASDLYTLLLRQPKLLERSRTRDRDRKGKRQAGEIFDQVINSPVTMNNGGALTKAPRMLGAVRRLLAKAVRGDIKSADMLITLHNDSLKHGDFFPETKYLNK